MSIQLKKDSVVINEEVKRIIEDFDTYDTVKTIRNWLKSDVDSIGKVVADLNTFLERYDNNESTDETIDAEKYYKLIEQYRYTISLMEQAIIEA
ncbi:MAG TPA: hypothetical protein VL854_06790 [Nitrososphaeraceae archaeon]|nr:hypothetical protein [Nitrososphaeraceae archaeon]